MGSTGPRTQGPQRKADFATCPHEAETAECVEEVITSREGARRGGGGPPRESPGCGWKDGAFCSWRWEGGECRYRQRVRKAGGRWKQQDVLREHVHYKLTRTDPPSLHNCVVLGNSLVLSGPYCFGFTTRRRQRPL